jgi:hypothetical protein
MKKIIIVVAAVVLAALIAAGSFWGGMAYQTNRANQIRENFMNSRGMGGGQFPNGGQGFPMMNGTPNASRQGFFGGRGTTGQVKSIDGNVLTLSTAQEVVTVNLSNTTEIQKTVSGTVSDLQPGMRVIVSGQRDNSGSITASQIQILAGGQGGGGAGE